MHYGGVCTRTPDFAFGLHHLSKFLLDLQRKDENIISKTRIVATEILENQDILKVKNQDCPDKIRTVGKYAFQLWLFQTRTKTMRKSIRTILYVHNLRYSVPTSIQVSRTVLSIQSG